MKADHTCPFCRAERVLYAFTVDSRHLYQCQECGLLFRSELLEPLPGALILTDIGFLRDFHVPKALDPEEKIQRLVDFGILTPQARILVFRCEDTDFLGLLAQQGVEVWAIESARTAHGTVHTLTSRELDTSAGLFDACVIFDSLGLNDDPMSCLERAWHTLKDDGTLVLSLPSLRSWPARLFRRAWVEFQKPYLYYFDEGNIQNLLFQIGFNRVILSPHRRRVTLAFLLRYLQDFPSRRVKLFRAIARAVFPGPLKRWPVSVRGSHLLVVARKAPKPVRRKLSVIVPVYNEKATFTELMNHLLAKEI